MVMFDGAVAKDDEGAKDSDITKEKSKIVITAEIEMSKRYLKYLT